MRIIKETFYAMCMLNRRNENGEKNDSLFYFAIPENRDFEPKIGQYAIVEYDNGFELVEIRGLAIIMTVYDAEHPVEENRILGILDKESGMSPYDLLDKVKRDNPSNFPF